MCVAGVRFPSSSSHSPGLALPVRALPKVNVAVSPVLCALAVSSFQPWHCGQGESRWGHHGIWDSLGSAEGPATTRDLSGYGEDLGLFPTHPHSPPSPYEPLGGSTVLLMAGAPQSLGFLTGT
jgi:hypothetical protein